MPLIVFEGIDGCGKSTQASALAQHLRAQGRTVLTPREPGATALGERLRGMLLDPQTQAGPVAEALAYLSARAQLVEEILRPAVKAGSWVVLDRFWYSTIAYQGYGLGLDVAALRSAIGFAVGELKVDAAFWLDVPPDVCAVRRSGKDQDRIERRGPTYMARVHEGYAALCHEGSLTRLDGQADPDRIADAIHAALVNQGLS